MSEFIACNNRYTIPLGRQGENKVVTIQFPIAKWLREYGAGGTWVLTNMRPTDTDAYPCAVTSDDNYVYWTLTDADVQYKGNGYAQLTYVKNGAVAKSEIFDTYIGKSLEATAEPPEPWKPWVDNIIEFIKTKLNKPDNDGIAGQVLKTNGDGSTYWGSGGGGSGAVDSVNGKTGEVVLDAEDVGALPDDTDLFSGDYNDLVNKPTIPTVPTNVSAFENDAGYLTEHQSLSGYATETYVNNYHDSTKQDAISDLATIRSGATLGATAVQPVAGKGLFSGNYNDLTNKPTIPTVPTDVSAFVNDANYQTADDVDSAIDTAVSGKINKPSEEGTSGQILATNGDGTTYWKTESGGGGGGTTDFDELSNRPKYNGSTMTRNTNIPEVKTATWNAKYDKPSEGIPKTDLATSVQASLGLADSALQSHQDISGKADASDLTDEVNRATAAEEAIAADVADIEALIPSQATSSNQLADKAFVNSTIGTNTANYISNNGQPFTSLAQLQAYSGTVTNNDYAFVTGTDSSGNTYYDRYKATVSGSTVSWAKEYRLNNSAFTAAQWSAIESGITSVLVNKLQGIESGAEVNVQSDWNQSDATADDFIKNKPTIPTVPTSLSAFTDDLGSSPTHTHSQYYLASNPNGYTDNTVANSKYSKPSGGIPKSDLATAVQTSLNLADTAIQTHQDISGKADKGNSFTVTLTVADWSNKEQNANNSNFKTSGYAYIVTPAKASKAAWGDAEISVDDEVTAENYLKFYCETVPTSAITVNITRVVTT